MADDVVPSSGSSSLNMENTDGCSTIFLDLPPEVIRSILILPNLGLKDVCRLAQTCQKMNALVSDDCNDVWRAKHFQRFVTKSACLRNVSHLSFCPCFFKNKMQLFLQQKIGQGRVSLQCFSSIVRCLSHTIVLYAS